MQNNSPSINPPSQKSPAPPESLKKEAASSPISDQPAGETKLSPMVQLLKAIWPSPDRTHFIGTLDRASKKFRNIAVQSSEEAQNFAHAYSAAGLDTYFAIAEYASPENRTSNNAVSVSAFIADIDVGADKSATGKGYATLDEAQAALDEFCVKTNLPKPNFIVGSGSGLHAYWIFGKALEREKWLIYAGKLKALMKSAGLYADPSRTADIAGVLRVPGTLNHKDSSPRPVELISSSDEPILLESILDAIDAAMVTLQVVTDTQVEGSSKTKSAQVHAPMAPDPFEEDIDRDPPNLLALASALKTQSPDCDEKTWKFHRLGPMAYEARYFPVLHDQLYKLARDWSSGELAGVPSEKWVKPGSNGLSGQQCFDRVWRRFLKDSYTGKRATLGTIFWHAKQCGWTYTHDDFVGGGSDITEVL